ncbi:MAG: RNA-binding protein [Clostridiales bacterium]|nr:MAG: RNA-binding protein [Clostridiales bacterium]
MAVKYTEKELWEYFIKKNQKYINLEVPESFYFCDNKKDADELAFLVKNKIKKGTSSLFYEYERENEELPKENEMAIVTDYDGNALAIINNVKVELIKFKDVSEELALKEGEGDKTLDYWRRVHIDFFTRILKTYDMKFSEEMLIVFEHFETVFTTDDI